MYTKDEIAVGLWMVKDGGPVAIKMSKPRPVRFGDPLPPPSSFSEVGDSLDQARARLLKLRDALHAAKRK